MAAPTTKASRMVLLLRTCGELGGEGPVIVFGDRQAHGDVGAQGLLGAHDVGQYPNVPGEVDVAERVRGRPRRGDTDRGVGVESSFGRQRDLAQPVPTTVDTDPACGKRRVTAGSAS